MMRNGKNFEVYLSTWGLFMYKIVTLNFSMEIKIKFMVCTIVEVYLMVGQ